MAAVRHRRSERGATAVIVAIMLMVLFGFLALVVDIGRGYTVRTQLQSAVDSAALAGVISLDGTAEGGAAAETYANDYASRHVSDGAEPVAAPGTEVQVQLGEWRYDLVGTGVDPFLPSTDPSQRNAVRVTAVRPAVQTFVAGVLGANTIEVGARATAVKGGPCKHDCAAPFAVLECQLEKACNEGLEFSPAQEDSMCFTNLFDIRDGMPPNYPEMCEHNAGNECAAQLLARNICGTAEANKFVAVQNGAHNNVKMAKAAFCKLQGLEVTDFGKGVEISVPVLETDTATLNDPECACNQGHEVLEVQGNKEIRGYQVTSITTIWIYLTGAYVEQGQWLENPIDCGTAETSATFLTSAEQEALAAGLPPPGIDLTLHFARACNAKDPSASGPGCDYFGLSLDPRLVE